MQLYICNPCFQVLTLKSQQNLHQVFLGVLRGNSLVICDIFILFSWFILTSLGAAMFISLSWTCWASQDFPMTLLFPSPLPDATALAGYHFGQTTHPTGSAASFKKSQASSVDSRGTWSPDCCWEVGENVSFSLDSLRGTSEQHDLIHQHKRC